MSDRTTTKVLKTIFQLRRGTAADWQRVNPILASGEPAYETDLGGFKIGNGVDRWNTLPYISSSSGTMVLQNYPSKDNFPETGLSYLLYKAENEKALYQWSETNGEYEMISSVSGVAQLDIEIINGGTANDE